MVAGCCSAAAFAGCAITDSACAVSADEYKAFVKFLASNMTGRDGEGPAATATILNYWKMFLAWVSVKQWLVYGRISVEAS